MRNQIIMDLGDCTAFRHTLAMRPPRLVRGTVLLLIGLLGTLVIWSAATKADLVVRAAGRVRPTATPHKVFNVASSGVLSAGTGGRVVEVYFREGDEVKQGEMLIRLDSARLENETAKQRRAIRSTEEALNGLNQLEKLMGRQFEAAKAKAAAELVQAQEDEHRSKERQAADIRLFDAEFERVQDEESRLRRLASRGAAAEADLVKASAQLREVREQSAKARLPVDTAKTLVAQRVLELVKKEYAVKREELEMKRRVKQAELEAARVELANRELERQQAEIRAQMDGVITQGDVKVGDVLEPGKAVVEIAKQEGFLFEVLVPSDEVGELHSGMQARIKLDAYDYQRYGAVNGTVCYISPDSGSVEGRQKALYVVRITLDSEQVGRGERIGRIKLGMAGQADFLTGQESLLALLVKQLRRTISLS